MEMLTFNINDGFCEALVRGYRSGFLKDVDYFNLGECAKLDDMRMNLSETDYGRFLEDEVRGVVRQGGGWRGDLGERETGVWHRGGYREEGVSGKE